MDLYSNKQRWKIILLGFAILMVVASLLISNQFVKKVAKREKERITKWADAIKKKADLVNLTNKTFDELREKERQKVELWGKATREIGKPSLDMNTDYTFLLEIIQQNKDIPVIVTNENKIPLNYINLSISLEQIKASSEAEAKKIFNDSLQQLCKRWAVSHPPFEIEVYKGIHQWFYYYDSKKINDLGRQRDSLITAFNAELIENQSLVPVFFVNQKNRHLIETNIDSLSNYKNKVISTNNLLYSLFTDSINVSFQDYFNGVIYFDESQELKQLKWYPYIQFGVVGLFILIAYLVFSTFRKAEQNQVWAGLAKETAHQLGTPISSLMAWTQLLDTQEIDKTYIEEIEKDVHRLSSIADRFSKIGSGAQLSNENIYNTLKEIIDYLSKRISSQITLSFQAEKEEIYVPHNTSLLGWVIENSIKNAVDAMDGKGHIQIQLNEEKKSIYIDIQDTGKGIPVKLQKTIFEPGFTTKKRGWGLGLSLAKRIINAYHNGKIFVLRSELNKGSCFRIILNKK
jgi:two-component sensor histidine kinase